MDKLRAAYRVSVCIGLAMMASLVVYLVVVALIDGGTLPLRGEPSLTGSVYEIVQFALLGAAAVVFFVIRMLNRAMLGTDGEQGDAGRRQPAAGPGGAAEFGRLSSAAVVTYALCEVPAIFGLVLYFMGRRITDFYLFLLLSFFFFATNFPRYSQWEEWYRRQEGGPGTPTRGRGDRETRGRGEA